MSAPIVEIIGVDANKVSDETGRNVANVTFKFDKPVQAYSVNVIGTSQTTGTVAGSMTKYVIDYAGMTVADMALMTVNDVRQIDTGTSITVEIDHTELYSEGSNKVNIYGKALDGIWTTYKDDYALDFNAVDTYINIANNSSLQIVGDQTIEIIMKPDSVNNRRNPINKAYGGEGTITHETNGTLNYYWGTSGGDASPYQGCGSGFTVGNGEFAHIAVVRDLSSTSKTIKWYKNSILYSTYGASYTSATASTSNLLIGNGYTNHWGGIIYEVRLWNIARTQQQIEETMNVSLSGKEAGLVGYWTFDEGSGTLINDYSLNSNDGTAYGTLSWVTR